MPRILNRLSSVIRKLMTRSRLRQTDGRMLGPMTALLGYIGVLALSGALAAWFWYRDDI